jgi:hypothetical protein
MTENLACQRTFGGPMGFRTKRNKKSPKLGSNETPSLCFRDPAEVKYVVCDSSDPMGEKNLAGTISIVTADLAQPVGRSIDRNESVASQSDKDESLFLAARNSTKVHWASVERKADANDLFGQRFGRIYPGTGF